MNALPLVLCSFVAVTASAQLQRPTGFSEISWRARMEEVRQTMLARNGISQMPQDSVPTRLAFAGGAFGGQPALVWGFEFVESGLYRGAVVLKSFSDRSKKFDDAKTLVATKYGPATSNSREGQHSKAIWRFRATLKEKDAVVVIVWNNPKGEGVHITYRNETMKAGGDVDEKGL